MSHSAIGRRRFIQGLSAALGVMAAGSILQACGGSSTGGGQAASSQASSNSSGEPSSSARAQSSSPVASSAAAAHPSGSTAAAGKPEKPTITVASAGAGSTFLPLYVARDHTFDAQGLKATVIGLDSDKTATQALVSNSADIILASMNGLINMIKAGEAVKSFYAGFNQSDFDWYGQPKIKSWADLKGSSVAISSYGSLTDFLTRYVLGRHQLEPQKDVQLLQLGTSTNEFAAVESGRVGAAILSAPSKYKAADDKLSLLGKMTDEVSPHWPKNIYITKVKTIEESPNTLRAFLRAHVNALRLARAQSDMAIQELVKNLKFSEPYAKRAYEEIIPSYDERGNLPTSVMPVFWKIAVASGIVKEPWDESKLLDRRFIDSFDQWAPPPSK